MDLYIQHTRARCPLCEDDEEDVPQETANEAGILNDVVLVGMHGPETQ